MNYRPEVENICKALEAVNLRISTNLKSPSREFLQVYNHFYHAALPEVSDFLTSVGLGVDIIGSGIMLVIFLGLFLIVNDTLSFDFIKEML
ncbi:hypothetical protein EUTSA_v10015281mg [Eutrema salsugineum]|uniref:Uncharacterized protein n=1 Tax=Eutrema salsugineum TaxID=72664 RepID=V4NB40_EUTSA|nr:hypothetical protein EUTSA_v10015281mg [Eutrema salsugineum]